VGSENPAGLLFYARVRPAPADASHHGATNDFASDKTWVWSTSVKPGWEQPGFDASAWTASAQLGDSGMAPWRITKGYLTSRLAASYPGQVRSALVAADPLQVALGRPNREQVVTTRPTAATTLQALELTNGETLADLLKRGARKLLQPEAGAHNSANNEVVSRIYRRALGREPSAKERQLAESVVGQPAQPAGVEDLVWAVAMLPEFQLIY
jgi:hypothetical protein